MTSQFGVVLRSERGDDVAHDLQGVGVVGGEVIGDAGDAGVQGTAAELFGGDLLAGGGLDQGRAAEEDRALVGDDDRLIGHGRNVGAAGGTGAEDGGQLRDPSGRERGLVVEDAAEVLTVGEHIVLVGQVRAAGVDEIDAREVVLLRDLLRPEVLLHGHGIVGAALDGGVVGHDDAFAAGDSADAGDDPGSRAGIVVHAVRGQRGEFEERSARIEEVLDALARQQLAPVDMTLPGLLGPASGGGPNALPEFGDEFGVGLGVDLPRRRTDRSSHCSHSILISVNFP
jgi:hypothetical protein